MKSLRPPGFLRDLEVNLIGARNNAVPAHTESKGGHVLKQAAFREDRISHRCKLPLPITHLYPAVDWDVTGLGVIGRKPKGNIRIDL